MVGCWLGVKVLDELFEGGDEIILMTDDDKLFVGRLLGCNVTFGVGISEEINDDSVVLFNDGTTEGSDEFILMNDDDEFIVG